MSKQAQDYLEKITEDPIVGLSNQISKVAQMILQQANNTSEQLMLASETTKELVVANKANEVTIEAVIHRDGRDKMIGVTMKVIKNGR